MMRALFVLITATIWLIIQAAPLATNKETIVFPEDKSRELSADSSSTKYFILTVQQKTLLLNISMNSFISPSLVNVNRLCYYTGNIQSIDNEVIGWTALSICNGMLGLLYLQNATYNIAPVSQNYIALNGQWPHQLNQQNVDKISGKCSIVKTSDEYIRLKRHEHKVLEKTIEVAVVADSSLLDIHQTMLTPYLLGIMNSVSHIFKDPSVGSIINIALVNLTIWTDGQNGVSSTTDSKTLKDNFCKWQATERTKSQTHHDIAILLTRKSICESKTSCGILGIANYKSVCELSQSCTVIKETGLSTAFTIAHEIGHSLGVYHDGDKNVDCNSGYFLMSASFEESVNPHQWSTCSKHQLYSFLNSQESACLNNDPTSTVAPPPSTAPLLGKNYTLDEQCQLLYGNHARNCAKTNCTVLWCDLGNGSCDKTQHSPPAAGSPCPLTSNSSGVCYHGQCQDHNIVSKPIHGQWGTWSEWSHCSHSCGNGIKHSDRFCNAPTPQYGGQHCVGEKRRYRLCHLVNCPINTKDYREKRCFDFGKNGTVGGLSHKTSDWTNVDSYTIVRLHLKPCRLYCRETGSSSVLELEKTVPTGVSCLTHRYTPGMCIHNKCIQVGCSGQLNTPYYKDICGVKCGDNSTCRYISTTFTPTAQSGEYQDIITIPSGSKDIEIEETFHSNNLIAAISKNYYFNGPATRPYQHHIVTFAGTKWHYGITTDNREYLHTSGPINESIKIQVYVAEDNTSITYQYIVPISQWKVSNWSSCSVHCGNGTQTRSVCCEGDMCDDRTQPPTTKVCSQESCDHFQWVEGPWSKCNVTCGEGHQTRTVTCKHINGTIVDDIYCTTHSKPLNMQSCTEPCDCVDTASPPVCLFIMQQRLCSISINRSFCCKSCSS